MKELFAVIILGMLIGCGESQKQIDPLKMPIEYQLAYLSAGKQIPANDPSVSEAKRLLEKAAMQYEQPPREIFDWAVKSSGALETYEIKESPLEVLEATVLVNDGSLPMAGQYRQLVVAYGKIRSNGMSRAEAIVGLRDLLKGIAKTKPKTKN